jgi:predicted NUDIX family NTP pyrophosphohydrolase
MPKISAGLLMYRRRNGRLEVLLVHPGGPFWAKKEQGAWSIPKGEVERGEDAFSTAKREFEEELGLRPEGDFTELGSVEQKGGKSVQAWAFEGNCDPASIHSNKFLMEWPPRSGKTQEFPEVDRAQFFDMKEAKQRINSAQAELLANLERIFAPGDNRQAERS